jgi:uncharacterized protein with PQ loop repeat
MTRRRHTGAAIAISIVVDRAGVRRTFRRSDATALVDRAMSVASVLHPFSAVPQVVSIYSTHDATGTSLLTWVFFMAIGVVFLSYSLVHRIRPLIVTQTLWFINDFLIVGGVLLYRD